MGITELTKNEKFAIDNGLVVTSEHSDVFMATKGRFYNNCPDLGVEVISLFVLRNRWTLIGNIFINRENNIVTKTVEINCSNTLPKYNEYKIAFRLYIESDSEDDEDEDDEYGLTFVKNTEYGEVVIATKGDYINGLFIKKDDGDFVKIGRRTVDGIYKFGNKYAHFRQCFE